MGDFLKGGGGNCIWNVNVPLCVAYKSMCSCVLGHLGTVSHVRRVGLVGHTLRIVLIYIIILGTPLSTLWLSIDHIQVLTSFGHPFLG